MNPHITLTVQDDGTLLAADDATLTQWVQALKATQQPRVCIATHGGLVGLVAGRDFATAVQQIPDLEWSVTFLTQTSLFSTLKKTLSDVMNAEVLDGFGVLVERMRQGDSTTLLPQSTGGPGGSHLLVRTISPGGHLGPRVMLQRVGPPQALSDAQAIAARHRVVKALQKAGALAPNLSDLVERAARAAARQMPPLSTQSAVDRALWLQQGARMPRRKRWDGSALTLGMPQGWATARAFTWPPTALQLDLESVKAILIETLTRELFEIPRLWQTMKFLMEQMYARNGAGDLLLRAFRDHPEAKLNLLGHSLGGIAVDHALRRCAFLGMTPQVVHAVYLAPANTWAFHHETRRALGQSAIMFHYLQLTDEEERDQRQETEWLGEIYPRSLLYLISEALEGQAGTPLLGMQKFWGLHSKAKDVRALTPQAGGLQHSAHGQFVQDACVRAWIAAQWP